MYAGNVREATYSSVPSGNYLFRVSTTANGEWTEAARWAFSVSPPFYRTNYSRLVVVLLRWASLEQCGIQHQATVAFQDMSCGIKFLLPAAISGGQRERAPVGSDPSME